jgi:hypothetical protein
MGGLGDFLNFEGRGLMVRLFKHLLYELSQVYLFYETILDFNDIN